MGEGEAHDAEEEGSPCGARGTMVWRRSQRVEGVSGAWWRSPDTLHRGDIDHGPCRLGPPSEATSIVGPVASAPRAKRHGSWALSPRTMVRGEAHREGQGMGPWGDRGRTLVRMAWDHGEDGLGPWGGGSPTTLPMREDPDPNGRAPWSQPPRTVVRGLEDRDRNGRALCPCRPTHHAGRDEEACT